MAPVTRRLNQFAPGLRSAKCKRVNKIPTAFPVTAATFLQCGLVKARQPGTLSPGNGAGQVIPTPSSNTVVPGFAQAKALNQTNPERGFWNQADTRHVGRMVVGGLFMGVVVRWLVISAPPLPVTATESAPAAISGSATNSVELSKTADASPSARD